MVKAKKTNIAPLSIVTEQLTNKFIAVLAERSNIRFGDYTEHTKQLDATLAKANIAERYSIEFKSCFGAMAGYVEGNIFISCRKFGLALKLPETHRNNLFEDPQAKPLKYFDKGHVKKEYVVLPKKVLSNSKRMTLLLEESINYSLKSDEK